MSSWRLPFNFNFSFSNFAPPLSLQRRFISFVLKRSLGHLLKPGQLDIDQIDAQIGSGFVEVRNLELDCNAINSLLDGLPLQLQSGSLGVVTVRIPWPNPFSSTIGLSLSGLQLEFRITETRTGRQGTGFADELAESVASVAESFIHDELSENEEAQLRQSVHLEQDTVGDVPGSMDPFLNQDQTTPHRPSNDPEGVSIFAGLFESLLARFDFDASDLHFSLNNDNTMVTLGISRLRYFTEDVESGRSSDPKASKMGGERTMQIQGVRVAMLDHHSPSSRQTPTDTPRGPSPEASRMTHDSSDSEMDEETHMMMSQSLVSLPPRQELRSGRAPSPSLSTISSASASSSMYQSAFSATIPSPPLSGEPAVDPQPQQRTKERTILAFSEPITLRLTTPPVLAHNLHSDSEDPHSPNSRGKERERELSENMRLDVCTGVIAILLDARRVRGLLGLVDVLVSSRRSSPNSLSESSTGQTSILDHIDVSLTFKGLVALVFEGSLDEVPEETAVSQFYERPLVPPNLPGGYLRLHVDTVRAMLRPDTSGDVHSSLHQSAGSPILSQSSNHRQAVLSCIISDVSVLAFQSSSVSSEDPGSASKNINSFPLLITDRNLADSYHSPPPNRPKVLSNMHIHPYSEEDKRLPLPTINVPSWSSEHSHVRGASLRPWRTRPATLPRHRSSSSGAGFVSSVGISTSPTRVMKGPLAANSASLKPKDIPALSAKLRLGGSTYELPVTLEVAPLHIFINLEGVRLVSEFIESALSYLRSDEQTKPPSPNSDWNEEDDDLLASPRTIGEERRRLERLVLDDLDLDLDYRLPGDTTPRRRASPSRVKQKGHRTKHNSTFRFDVLVPLLRVEIRVPPPRNRQPRSGTLVLDIHSARFSSSARHLREFRRVPRFDLSGEKNSSLEEWFSGTSATQPVSLEMKRVVVAYADLGRSKAETLLSLGPLGDARSEATQDEGNSLHLFPLILFRNCDSSDGSARQAESTSVLARVPSLHGVVNKACLDGIQLWVDDLSQWFERLNGQLSGNSTRTQVSRANSLIGSRYFIQRTGSGSTESEVASTVGPSTGKGEVIVKACLSEAFIRLVIPMGDSAQPNKYRFLDICASDLDALVEVKPEGKDETILSLNVLDASVEESSSEGSHTVVSARPLGINRPNSSALKLRFRSVSLPGTVAKESRVRVVHSGLIFNLWSDKAWITDLLRFVKAPAGAFESVIPSERTHITINAVGCALRLTPPSRPSAIVLSLGDVTISTDLVGASQETVLNALVSELAVLLNDDEPAFPTENMGLIPETDAEYWMNQGYALLSTVKDLTLYVKHDAKKDLVNTQVVIKDMHLSLHLCADTLSGISAFVADLQSLSPADASAASTMETKLPRRPANVSDSQSSTLLHSLDEQAFRRQPVIGPLPDMVSDDLPQNPEYLDASFGAAGGLRALDDEEDEEFFPQDTSTAGQTSENVIERHGGETVTMLFSPIEIIENYFDTLTPSSLDFASQHGDTSFMVRAQDCHVQVLLYDGYDWERTRKSIQEEVKRVRRRLARIRQLLANGQSYDPNVEEVNSVLFDSVYVGLEPDAEDLERDALMAAIDDELGDEGSELASESSWQSFKPNRRIKAEAPRSTLRFNKLTRAKGPSIEFSIRGMAVDFDQYLPGAGLASRLLSTIKDLEILDHIRTSTWSTFLTEMRSDSRGNIRETDSNMVRVELQMLQPFQAQHEQEARLKAKLLPLRLHVDQDALDFLKKFFSFKDGDAAPSPPPENEIFFQHVEIFPIDIKLDYKPRRVDYRALKEGKTIELMNFFHFDGSEMTLRHITLKGITGWPRMFDTLNDLWTPDVKANQLVDVISGVSPIRSAVNVGSGVADLVLLPIAQYKKDGRIIRGLQKGTTAFMKSTGMEAIRLGARLATGTQVVLEQAENVLGAQFSGPVTAEAFQAPDGGNLVDRPLDVDSSDEDLYSKYAEQPTDVREGVQSAYRSLSKNMKTAGQTILAVPMEVYERSGKEGPARAVIRAVPIAVLKPMIGASEAISKALLGLHNTLDPEAQIDTEAKYKHR